MKRQADNEDLQTSGLLLGSEPLETVRYKSAAGGDDDKSDKDGDSADDDSTDMSDSDGTDGGDTDTRDADGKD